MDRTARVTFGLVFTGWLLPFPCCSAVAAQSGQRPRPVRITLSKPACPPGAACFGAQTSQQVQEEPAKVVLLQQFGLDVTTSRAKLQAVKYYLDIALEEKPRFIELYFFTAVPVSVPDSDKIDDRIASDVLTSDGGLLNGTLSKVWNTRGAVPGKRGAFLDARLSGRLIDGGSPNLESLGGTFSTQLRLDWLMPTYGSRSAEKQVGLFEVHFSAQGFLGWGDALDAVANESNGLGYSVGVIWHVVDLFYLSGQYAGSTVDGLPARGFVTATLSRPL